MKVYKFFQKPKKYMHKVEFSDLSMNLKYPLYAITNDKVLAKKFKETRNMDLFIERVGRMEKDEFKKYSRVNRDNMLTEDTLETIRYRLTNHQQSLYANIVMTERESAFVMDAIDTGSILNQVNHWIPIHIFEKEIKDALYLLKYEKAYKFIGIDPADGPTDDFFDLGFTFDQLAVFIVLYGDTLTEKFYTGLKLYEEIH